LREPEASDAVPPRPDAGEVGSPGGGRWRRLHPAAVAVWIASSFTGLLLPLLVVLVIGGRSGPEGFTLLFAAVVVVANVVRWWRFEYRVDGRTLRVRGGLLQRWERTLPPARIQSVDVVEKLTHRVFGVVELRIEVVGGQTTEAQLVALPPEGARELRELLIADRTDDRRLDAVAPLIRMRPTDLLLAGLTGGRVAVAAAIAGWVFQVLPEGTIVSALDRLVGTTRSQLATVVAIAAALVLVSLVISLVTTVAVHWDHTVVREGDRLTITRGLLQTRRSVIPMPRIQAIRLEENLLRRALGLASVRVLTAGYGRGGEGELQTSMLIPVARRATSASIVESVLGADGLTEVGLAAAPPAALTLRAGVATVVATAGAAGAWLSWGTVGAAAAGLTSLGVLLALAYVSWRNLGHAVAPPHVVARWGTLVRRTSFANHANVQHLVLRRSPAQRALGLATVTLAIPRASASFVDVDAEVAEGRFAELSGRIGAGVTVVTSA
jgi:putative membrane protein